MQKVLFFFTLFLSTNSFSQNLAFQYSNQLSEDSIKQTLYTLASDSMEGRETGREGQRKASEILIRKYKSFGLTPGDKQECEIGGPNSDFKQIHALNIKQNKTRNLTINGEKYLFGKDFFYFCGKADTNLIIDKFLFLGINKNDREGKTINKISRRNFLPTLIYDPGESLSKNYTYEIPIEPSTNQPAFLIASKETIYKLFTCQDFQKASLFSYILITPEVAERFFKPGKFQSIINKFEDANKGILKKQKCELSMELVSDTRILCGQNIVSMIPGSDSNGETVVISSHYDHLGKNDSLTFYGADDNASGTSALVELARIFQKAKKEGHGPKRNILFLNVSGEEKGLLGSSWFVKHPTLELKDIVVDLNVDMIGRTDPIYDSLGIKNYLYIIGADRMSKELHRINEAMNDSGPKLILDYKYNDPDEPNNFYKRSDHYNFIKNNIPAIFYFNGTHADYHKSTDTPDKIDFDLLVMRAKLIFMTAWELANRNERIVVDVKEIDSPANK